MRVHRPSRPYTVPLKSLYEYVSLAYNSRACVRAYLCEGQHTRGARQRMKKGVEEMETNEIICGVTGDYVCLSTKRPSAIVLASLLFLRFRSV